MKISVIIPTCDRQDFLQEAIDSVKAQTLSVHEIIVVNNGNTPIEKDSPLHTQAKILELPPYSGASMARNTGALQATGDYLAFLDDDDNKVPCYLTTYDIVNGREVLNVAESGPVD